MVLGDATRVWADVAVRSVVTLVLPELMFNSSRVFCHDSRQVQFCVDHPEIGRSVLLFSILSAVGQLFIFYSLLLFDSLVCTTITTTRKFLTIVISVVFHGNVLSTVQWLAVAMVFGAVMYDAKPRSKSKARRNSDVNAEMLLALSTCKPSSV